MLFTSKMILLHPLRKIQSQKQNNNNINYTNNDHNKKKSHQLTLYTIIEFMRQDASCEWKRWQRKREKNAKLCKTFWEDSSNKKKTKLQQIHAANQWKETFENISAENVQPKAKRPISTVANQMISLLLLLFPPTPTFSFTVRFFRTRCTQRIE